MVVTTSFYVSLGRIWRKQTFYCRRFIVVQFFVGWDFFLSFGQNFSVGLWKLYLTCSENLSASFSSIKFFSNFLTVFVIFFSHSSLSGSLFLNFGFEKAARCQNCIQYVQKKALKRELFFKKSYNSLSFGILGKKFQYVGD